MTTLAKKIAVVTPYYGLAGGSAKFAAELTERIACDPRYEMHVFANKWQQCSEKVTFHALPIITFPKFLTTPSFSWFANRQIRAGNFDLIHSHERIGEADLFTMHGTPHRYWIKEVRRKRMSLFDLATARVEASLINNPRCRRFFAVSQLAAGTFVDGYPEAKSRMEVMAPGVELRRFSLPNRAAVRAAVRERYRIGGDDFLALFVGMNFPLKGLAQSIAALAEASKAAPGRRISLLVVGRGDERKYRKIAAAHGVEEQVIFAGVVEEKIEELYGAADLLLMLSEFETFGMTVLEAMAASLPVIVASRVGAKDLISEGENGFVVERDDLGAISQRLVALLDRERWEAMAAAALHEAQAHAWEKLAERTKVLYAELLQG